MFIFAILILEMIENINVNRKNSINLNFKNNSKNKILNAYDLAIKSGVFSKDDYNKYKKYKFACITKDEFLVNINNIIEKTFAQTKKMGKFLLYKKDKQIPKGILQKLKIERLKMNLNKEIKPLPYRENDSYLIHPRNKIYYIIGENTNNDLCDIKKIIKLYSKVPLSQLLIKKDKILKQLCSYTKYNFFPDNIFSNSELKKIQILVNHFDAIKNILTKNHIYTENVECLLYSDISGSLETNAVLPNKDKIIGFSRIYNKNTKSYQKTFITTSITDRGIRFKSYLYNPMIENITKYKKMYNHFLNTQNVNDINNLDTKIFNIIKNSEIAEVYIEVCDKNEMRKKMKNSELLDEKNIENILGDENEFYYIKNLKNFNNKIFYNSSITLIDALKNYGKNSNIKKGFIEALAFGNSKHSPVALYLKVGCKPITESEENLKAKISEGFNYKKNVWFVYNI